MALSFADHFDEALATAGPPAVFALTADGELRLHGDRTRDAWQRLAGGIRPPLEPCHCLFRDRATGWVQYLLVTSPVLCAEHPRADVWRYASADRALAALAALGPVPVWRDPGPPPEARV